MKVSELIAELSRHNPTAEVGCWASDSTGEPYDDVANCVELDAVASWTMKDIAPSALTEWEKE